MTQELPPRHNPKDYEEKIYALWEKSGFFNPDNLSKIRNRKLPSKANRPLAKRIGNFCIIMPPPNANGALHIGHALFVTLEDIMIRYKRMRGFKTLWLPGADHAGFETQVVYQKKLEKEGRSLWDIPKEKLYKEILDFTLKNKKHMENQLRQLGASCDWSREKFTLDPNVVKIVHETFKMLWEDGLLYRAERPVNWCTKHQTTLSELETKYEERVDPLYYIKYGPLELATVRPETKFGDTGIAVNPKDKRYKKYVGQEIKIDTLLGQRKIKVIADEAVDPNFGTGVIKITPAHDRADFTIWQRHKNEIPGPKAVIDKFGRLNELTGPYKGLKIKEAREKIVKDMKKRKLLIKIEPSYKHNIQICYKCGTTIEPIILPQWWIRMTETPKRGGDSLRNAAVKAVKSGQVKFVTRKFEKIFMNWMKNLEDWNISRQIAWGIRIPAWYHEPKCLPKEELRTADFELRTAQMAKCQEIVISDTEPKCEYCGAKFIQDQDVFDTWFSSGQWPFATLMANDKAQTAKNEDLNEFYPTTVMETGWDILFFWVARMIMLGIYCTGKVPFKVVYLHGLVRDKDRQKMSKSKGNVIDPLGIADTYGADAVRMSLVTGTAPGNDPVISEEKIRGYRNFATKVWNAARFVMMRKSEKIPPRPKYAAEDRKILKEFTKFKKSVTKDMESHRFHEASNKIYQYFWHTFADKVIESAKPHLVSNNQEEKRAASALLTTLLTEQLKLLHPFMPFVTETIYQELHHGKKMLMVEEW